jgi:hypothetical protein
MDLANMRRQGVHHLIAYCLNDSCRHQALIDVSKYPGDTPVPWVRSKVKCAKCGARGNRIDVRPNWKEAPGMPDDWSAQRIVDGTLAQLNQGHHWAWAAQGRHLLR